jgi:hypothetical protein
MSLFAQSWKGEPMGLTWTCHVCGRERPDDKIRVWTTDLSDEWGLEYGTLRQNVRYCEDNADCVIKAQTLRLVSLGRTVQVPKND